MSTYSPMVNCSKGVRVILKVGQHLGSYNQMVNSSKGVNVMVEAG